MHDTEGECLSCKLRSFNLLLVVCNVHNCIKRSQRTELHDFFYAMDVHYYATVRFAYVDNEETFKLAFLFMIHFEDSLDTTLLFYIFYHHDDGIIYSYKTYFATFTS